MREACKGGLPHTIVIVGQTDRHRPSTVGATSTYGDTEGNTVFGYQIYYSLRAGVTRSPKKNRFGIRYSACFGNWNRFQLFDTAYGSWNTFNMVKLVLLFQRPKKSVRFIP